MYVSTTTDIGYNHGDIHDNVHNHDNDNDNDNDDDDEIVLISIDDAIDRIGHGKFQHRIMMAAGLCFAADAVEIVLLSFLAVVLQRQWDLTDAQFSAIFGSLFAGAFLGTLVLGTSADVFGRKPVFVLTASIICLFGMLTALAQSFPQLCLARFLVGVGVGGITVPFDTLAEFMPTHARAKGLVTTSYYWCVASLAVPVVARVTLGQQDSNWRLFVLVCALPCLVSALVGVFVVPESPRWLCQQQQQQQQQQQHHGTGHSYEQQALAILRNAARINGHDQAFSPATRIVTPPHEHYQSHASLADLLSREWRKTTLTLWCLWGSYAFLYYGTVLAVTLAFSHDNNNNNHSNNNQGALDYTAMIVASSAELVGVTLVKFTVDRFGRIPCLKTYFGAGGFFVVLLCLRSPTTATTDQRRWERIGWAFLARLFVYSGSNIVWIVTAEVLHTRLRTTGHSCANAVARIGAFLAPYGVSPSKSPGSMGVAMAAATCILQLCVHQLPETMGLPMGVMHPMSATTPTSSPTQDSEGGELITMARHQAVPTEETFLDQVTTG